MCHNRIRNQKMRNIRREMQKQVPMTISYFMPLVTKIYIFLGDDEVVPSIDPAKVCQGVPVYVHSLRKQREIFKQLINFRPMANYN